jgi:uncharacterized protein YebE (UPF0316 family)
MFFENKLAIGLVTIRAIIRRDPKEIIETLPGAGYGIAAVEDHGRAGTVKIIRHISPGGRSPLD